MTKHSPRTLPFNNTSYLIQVAYGSMSYTPRQAGQRSSSFSFFLMLLLWFSGDKPFQCIVCGPNVWPLTVMFDLWPTYLTFDLYISRREALPVYCLWPKCLTFDLNVWPLTVMFDLWPTYLIFDLYISRRETLPVYFLWPKCLTFDRNVWPLTYIFDLWPIY